MDQGSNENHSPVNNFAPTVNKFCVMWEGQALPHDTKFGNCRDKIVDSRAFLSWSLIHGSSWSGLIKVGPGCVSPKTMSRLEKQNTTMHYLMHNSWHIQHIFLNEILKFQLNFQWLLKIWNKQGSTLKPARMPGACRSHPRAHKFCGYVPDWASDFLVRACTYFPSSIHKLYRACTNIGWARDNFCKYVNLSIGLLEANISEIWIKLPNISLKKRHFKMSSTKCWPFSLSLNMLTLIWYCRQYIPALGVNTMPADTLAPKVARALAGMALAV